MSASNNRRKDELLGEPHGTATGKLRKALLFKYVKLAGHDSCYRCGKRIEDVADFSVEHTEPWQSSPSPRDTFFDLDKIAFSHHRCNVALTFFTQGNAANPNTVKTHCDHGHEFTVENTHVETDGGRQCKACRNERMRGYRAGDKNYGRGVGANS